MAKSIKQRNRKRNNRKSIRRRGGAQPLAGEQFIQQDNDRSYSVNDQGNPNSLMASVRQNVDALPPNTMNVILGTVAAAALGVGIFLTIR